MAANPLPMVAPVIAPQPVTESRQLSIAPLLAEVLQPLPWPSSEQRSSLTGSTSTCCGLSSSTLLCHPSILNFFRGLSLTWLFSISISTILPSGSYIKKRARTRITTERKMKETYLLSRSHSTFWETTDHIVASISHKSSLTLLLTQGVGSASGRPEAKSAKTKFGPTCFGTSSILIYEEDDLHDHRISRAQRV